MKKLSWKEILAYLVFPLLMLFALFLMLSRIIQVWKPDFHEKPVSVQNFGLKSHFGVFTH